MLASTQPPAWRRAAVVFGVALIGLGVTPDARVAQASCVAPSLSLDRVSGAAGDVVELRGENFGTGCNDVEVGGTFGGPPLGQPRTGIALVIVQGDQVIPLGSIDANMNYEFGVQLAIPTQLGLGEATIRVDQPASAPVASVSFTVTSTNGSTGVAATTTVLLNASTTGSSVKRADIGSNRLAPWLWGLIGFGVIATLAVLAASKVRAQRRAS